MADANNSDAGTPWQSPKRGWFKKFADAFRGIVEGIEGQRSFVVHLPMALAVIVLATILGVSVERLCILLICVAMVLASELFNSSIELICKSVTDVHDDNIRRALNIASASVLVLSIFATVIGILILGLGVADWLNLFAD